jgi:hypothetical protein
MKRRSVAAVLILSIVTFGIYAIVWAVKTKEEMNALGAQIPTAWLLIIPLITSGGSGSTPRAWRTFPRGR